MTMVRLVGHNGGEGAEQALTKVFDCNLERDAPHRSSFCRHRQNLDWRYFHDLFYRLLKSVENHRTTFNGLRCYAIDGQQLTLPRTRDLRMNGLNGRFLDDDMETYMLKGYWSHCYDLLTGVSKGITFNSTLNEHRDRAHLLKLIEPNSLVIYDRLYFSEDLVNQHHSRKKSYFLARCKETATLEIREFSGNRDIISTTTTRYGHRISFIKSTHPKTGTISIYATNLPESWLKPRIIAKLYRMRWRCETSFLEFTGTLKCEQWHSKTLNGILQEFYCALWVINFTKICMLLAGEKNSDPMKDEYEKSNFKACCNFIIEKMAKYFYQPKRLVRKLIKIVRRTNEKRVRDSRSYPRQIKSPQSPYAYNNTIYSKADPPNGMRTSIVPA
jgi:hypothetical protein